MANTATEVSRSSTRAIAVKRINRTRTKLAAAAITVAYTLFYGLMPIILGNASDSRGLNEREIGFLASTYMTGQALGYFSGVFCITW